jgi:tRNA(Ile)-lysidine synthetase-like protein
MNCRRPGGTPPQRNLGRNNRGQTVPCSGGPHRSLKNLLQEQAIPPWQRDRLPLLWCDGRLVWAAGIGLEADLLAAPGEAGVLPRVAG